MSCPHHNLPRDGEPELARDPKYFGREITRRFHQIWYYDIDEMVKVQTLSARSGGKVKTVSVVVENSKFGDEMVLIDQVCLCSTDGILECYLGCPIYLSE